MKETILECQNLGKRYHHRGDIFVALNGVSVEFLEGQWTGIKGYSGSGKSTMLNLIAGLDSPTEGDVIFLGHSFRAIGNNKLSSIRRKWLGLVLQELALVEHLTAQENVELPGLLSGTNATVLRERSDKVFESVRLGHRKEHYPNELSGGECQRVAIARALMVEDARVLIADEPTSSLDTRSAREIAEIFEGLAKKGLCIITASHDDRLLPLADRILFLEDGCISDRPDEL